MDKKEEVKDFINILGLTFLLGFFRGTPEPTPSHGPVYTYGNFFYGSSHGTG